MSEGNTRFTIFGRSAAATALAAAATLAATASDGCPGDLDCSGRVDAPDVAALLAAWGTGDADLNGDGITGAQDLAALLAGWGPCAGCSNASWLEGYGQDPTIGNTVRAMIEFDDGSGSKLWIGGILTNVAGAPAANIAQWNGSRLSVPSGGLTTTLGSLLTAEVYDLEVFNGELFAAGNFNQSTGVGTVNGIARWDGSAWQPLGTGLQLSDGYGGYGFALEVYQGQLYVAGDFDFAGGQPAANLARWDGSSWSGVDIGLGGSVYALESFNDGATDWLVVGGYFTRAGSVPGGSTGFVANQIARWSPATSWQPFQFTNPSNGNTYTGLPQVVYALEATYVGGTPALYVGGAFDNVGGNTAADRIVRWSNGGWSALGSGFFSADVRAIELVESGGGLTVYAGGTMAGGIQRFTGTGWVALDTGLSGYSTRVYAMHRGVDGFLVGGSFNSGSGRTFSNLARWTGSVWEPLSTGVVGDIATILPMPGSGGSQVFLGGTISRAGGRTASNAVVWNGTGYASLGGGVNGPINVAVEYQGSLIVAGSFTNAGTSGIPAARIARWNGTSWSQLLGGVNGTVTCMLVVGSDLYVGGSFTSANGVAGTAKVARWNGTAWSSVAPTTVPTPVVKALAYYQGKLHVGGSNYGTGLPPLHRLDGTSWAPLLGPYNGLQSFAPINAMTVVDFDGCGVGGEMLAIGGTFNSIHVNGQPLAGTEGIALWNGQAWSGTGLDLSQDFEIRSLAAYPDGAGESLVIAGHFSTVGGQPVDRVARFDGGAWLSMGASFGGIGTGTYAVRSLGIADRNGRPEVMVGGSFTIGPGGSACLASWGCRD